MKTHYRIKQRNTIIKWVFRRVRNGSLSFICHAKILMNSEKNPAELICRVLLILIKDRRQRERRNRRKNLWGNVSLLRGWQQHPRIDVVTSIIPTINSLIREWNKIFEE